MEKDDRQTFIALKATHTAHRVAMDILNPSTEALTDLERVEKVKREHELSVRDAIPLRDPSRSRPLPELPEFLRQPTSPPIPQRDWVTMYVVLGLIIGLTILLAWVAAKWIG